MNWVALTWPMLAAASLVLGLVHGLVWLTQKRLGVHLAFAIAAVAVAALILLEMAALYATSPQRMGELIRWMHLPVAVMVVAMVYVVHVSFGLGSRWLALGAVSLRVAALAVNFASPVNLNFRSITAVARTEWWQASVHYPIGELNPWVLLSQASNALLLVYLLQTIFRGIRAAEETRSSVLVICGGWLLLIVVMMTSALLMALGVPRIPLTATPSFVIVVLAMSWQLGRDLFKSERLTHLLQESEVRRQRVQKDLELAASAPGLGLWSWDVAVDGYVENASNREILGGAPGDLDVRRALFGRTGSPGREALERRFAEAMRRPSWELEYPIVRDDGERRWVSLTGSVEATADGQPTLVRGVTRDVTRLKNEQEVLRILLEAAPSALLLADAQGIIRYANLQASRVFGYEDANMVGMHVDALLPTCPDLRKCEHHRHDAVHPIAREMGHEIDPVGVRRDGTEFPIEVGLSPLTLANQPHVVASVTDLTERRELEMEMAMEREGIAHLSRVTMLGELSGSLAHELNQPLAAILSNAQAAQRILRRDPSDIGEVQAILGDIVDNDRRAGQVINRLRGLLKKEHREQYPLLMNEVVLESIRLMRNDLLNRRVAWRMDLTPGIPRVVGDRIQLQQVLLNLIFNACDALPEENCERIVTVRTVRSELGVCTEVVDSGQGIPEAMLETIFRPFESTKPNGMGMGLAVCRTIVRAHGGHIWAENREAGGTRVCFDLPGVE
ncbi:ATP-binding protein [Lysobacter sp. FW306-1B-D06B]|uniref:ATP-binding protein n=1 Tax=Lysobacter sp. FW306-1B-D06B TaxID=3140250 RepID=UPI0031405A77